jgi:nucleotide-binding universal stress UspA family protein
MLKRILVGLNGSEYSRAAGEVAIGLAKKQGAAVVGLGIVDVPHLTGPEAVPLGAGAFKMERDAAFVEAADQRISLLLADFAQQCSQAEVSCQTLKMSGDPEKLMNQEAQRVDLLVVGKKSTPESPGMVASHVLRQTLRNATRPVLCVSEFDSAAFGTAPVLVAYDGSPQAAKALQMFQAIGLASGRDIHLLVVADGSDDQHNLELAAEYLRAYDHQVQFTYEESELPASSVILSEARRLNAALIVMGAYGQSPIKELFFGSVTRGVLGESKLPLFLYH